MLEQWLRLSNDKKMIFCCLLEPVATSKKYMLYKATGPEELLQFYLLLVEGDGKFDEAFFIDDILKLNIKNLDSAAIMRQVQTVGERFTKIKVLNRRTTIEDNRLVITYE